VPQHQPAEAALRLRCARQRQRADDERAGAMRRVWRSARARRLFDQLATRTRARGVFSSPGPDQAPPLIVPTIDGWIVQWKPVAPLLTVIDLVVAPGETLPTSVPLSSTMWWSVESLFRQTTLLPAAALAGLGANAALPKEPTIAIVTCDDGAGDGAGAGAGDGAGADEGAGEGTGDGDCVVEGELGDEYPPPHAVVIRAIRAAATVRRGKDIVRYLLVTKWSGAGIDRLPTSMASAAPRCTRAKWAAACRARSRAVTPRESSYARRLAPCARSLYH